MGTPVETDRMSTVDEQAVFDTQETDLFELFCRRRGFSRQFLTAIEDDSHDELKDLDRIVAALEDARRRGCKVTIAPDFDMDGIASGVLGYAGLSELGFDVELHVPDYNRGHDLTVEDIDEIAQRWPDTAVLLTCDGAINSHEGIAAARERGWTTLVTDHHEELPPGCPADVAINPHRIDETYSHPGICGAYVLYQVIEAYTAVHQPQKMWQIRLLRLFAGLGTVSDVMPVLFENRALIRDSLSIARLLLVNPPHPGGPYSDADPDSIDVSEATLLQLLNLEDHHPVFRSAFTGFAVMLKAFTQYGKIRGVESIDEGFYGFYLAPAMNSPRRIGTELQACFAVFTADAEQDQLLAAHQVIEGNEVRKQLVAEHLEQLLDDVENSQPLAPWVYLSDAPKGMLGLLANQLMQRGGHPVVVVQRTDSSADPISGSARAPQWFDVISTLEQHEGLDAVGHQQACGVIAETPARLHDLVDVLAEATRAEAEQQDPEAERADLTLGPDDDCDVDLREVEALKEFVRRVEELKPFGHGFDEPEVELRLNPAQLRLDRIGSEGQHLRLVSEAGTACLWWNAADEHHQRLGEAIEAAVPGEGRRLCFTSKLQLNTFRGETRLQAVINQQLDH